MDISSNEAHIPMPINSYGSLLIHDPSPQNHIIPSSASPISSNGPITPHQEDHIPCKKVVRYRECLKNHAAAMGGNVTDGCGEFMPDGDEGTLEALKCSACSCHRNFHRKEAEGEPSTYGCYPLKGRKLVGQKGVLIAGPEAFGYPTGNIIPRPPTQMFMPYNLGIPSESDEQEGGEFMLNPSPPVKKRSRTKFTREQKEKMLAFAEMVGWRIQRLDESAVQQFCQEIGVKRSVLKVWMHNNKHNLAKKGSTPST